MCLYVCVCEAVDEEGQAYENTPGRVTQEGYKERECVSVRKRDTVYKTKSKCQQQKHE